jgi:hypothetical protein
MSRGHREFVLFKIGGKRGCRFIGKRVETEARVPFVQIQQALRHNRRDVLFALCFEISKTLAEALLQLGFQFLQFDDHLVRLLEEKGDARKLLDIPCRQDSGNARE